MVVADLMSFAVVAISVHDDLVSAGELMSERHIRHLPVVDSEDRLVGIVSQRDLLRNSAFAESAAPDYRASMKSVTIGDIMSGGVTTVSPDTDIRDAAQVMLENKYGCLPVVVSHRLVGILTEADFVRLMAEGDS